jgi:hypothetical protein
MIDRSKKRNGLARKNKKQVFVTYVFHCLSFVFAWLFLFVNFVFVFLHMIPFQQNVKLKKLVEKDVKKKQGEKSDTERANSSFLFNLWSSGLFVLQCSFQSKLVGATQQLLLLWTEQCFCTSQMPISCLWTINIWSWSIFSPNMSMFAAEKKANIPCNVRPPSCVFSHL